MIFIEQEGDTVILVQKGVFRQAALFRCGLGIFAKYGSGFVRLYERNGTSSPNVKWDHLSSETPYVFDKFGRMIAEAREP